MAHSYCYPPCEPQSTEAEDFSMSQVRLFLFNGYNRWVIPCTADLTGLVKAEIPGTLAEAVYSLELVWVKNNKSINETRCIQRTRKPCVFMVDGCTEPCEAEAKPEGEAKPVVLEMSTLATPYGYDGLSAYEIAVMRGTTTLDEKQWSEGLYNEQIAKDVQANKEGLAELGKKVEGLENKEDSEQVKQNTDDIAELQKDITGIKSKEFKTINGEAVVGKGDIKIKGYSNLTWGSTSDMNKIASTGIYVISGARMSMNDNMPIGNVGTNASISATLLVTESPEGETTYRSIIGQTLMLSNAEGHETKIYTRSANKTSYDGGVTYEITWGDWQVCQGMKEVGVVSSYDSFTDNGMYSGVYDNKKGIIETFVIITINDYAVKSQLNAPKSVSQLKYALNALNNKSELSVRVGGGQEFKWSEWKPVLDEENITTQITNIQNQLNTLTEGTTGSINGILTAINDLQNLKVIDLGSNLRPDQATYNIIAHVRNNNIKHAILFKYIDPDNSSTLGVCISRMGTSGWLIYLIARKGIERLQFNSAGAREAWNEYGGILRHQQNAISDGQLETMSVNGLKSLIIDNLNTNEDGNSRNLLSILSANQGRILNEKINANKIIVVDNLTSTSATNALSANMGRMLAQEILKMAPKTYVDTAIANAITTTLNTEV